MVQSDVNLNNGLSLTTCSYVAIHVNAPANCIPQTSSMVDATLIGTFFIGQTIQLTGNMNVAAGGSGGSVFTLQAGNTGASSALVQADHTALTFLKPLGDFFFVAESGHDYTRPLVSSVPEPAPMLLFCVGLLALGISRLRTLK